MTDFAIDVIIRPEGAKRGSDQVKRELSSIDAAAERTGKLISRALGGITFGLAVRSLARVSDQFTTLKTQLENVTDGTKEYNEAFSGLFAIAQRDGSSLVGLNEAFVKLNTSISDSVKQSVDLVKVTDILSRGFAASGTSAQTAAGATLQLTQGLATNFKAAGQELNSIIEGAPLLAKIIAQELGGKAATDLKVMAEAGDLTAEAFLRAVIRAEEAVKAFEIPDTIGRSIQRVNNEFLRLIGTSDLVQSAAGTLSLSIDQVAANLGNIIRLVTTVAVVIGARYVSAVVAATGATLAQTAAAGRAAVAAAAEAAAFDRLSASMVTSTRMTAALAKQQIAMAGSVAAGTVIVNRAGQAAIVTTTMYGRLAASARLAGAAIYSAIGGPIGIAIIGTYVAMTTIGQQAAKAQDRINSSMQDFKLVALEYHGASDRLKKKIEDDVRSRIEAYKLELQALYALFNAYQEKGFAGRFLQNLGGQVGIGKGIKEIVLEGAAIENALADLEDIQKNLGKPLGGGDAPELGTGAGAKAAKKALEEQEKLLKDIKGAQLDYGKNLTYLDNLLGQGLITQDEFNLKLKDMDSEVLQLSRTMEGGLQRGLLAIEDKFGDVASVAEDTLVNAFGAAEDALVNFVTTGKLEFTDLVNSILEDVARLVIRQQITAPLAEGIGSFFSGSGGGIGDFLGSIFGGFRAAGGPVDSGKSYVVGERGPELFSPGRSGVITPNGGAGAPVVINVINNTPSNVQVQQSRDGGQQRIEVIIDEAVAKNINNGATKTNAALRQYNSREVIRR